MLKGKLFNGIQNIATIIIIVVVIVINIPVVHGGGNFI